MYLDLMAVLVVWRITSMLVNESGPFRIFEGIRWLLYFTRVLECFMCTSVWIGFAAAFYLERDIILFGLAYSAIAIFIESRL